MNVTARGARSRQVVASNSCLALILLFLATFALPASAQVTGTRNIPGDYATLEAAIADVNAVGVGAGGATLNLIAGNPQTAPAGGYVIQTTTTSPTNPLSLVGNDNVITAFTPQASGVLTDAIFKIVGSDNVRIASFTMLENPANTTTAAGTNNMTEFGVALFYATVTDNAQNVTLNANNIDLDRTYQNTFGIYANATHPANDVAAAATGTGATGGNNNLVITSNHIQDVNNGIVVVGPTANADHNNNVDIGSGGAGTGNLIDNFGTTGTFSSFQNVSGSVNGILVRNSRAYNIAFNTIASSNGGVTAGALRGVHIPAFNNLPTGTFTNNIVNNSISLRPGAAGIAGTGIDVLGTTSSTASVLNINNNDFNTFGHTVAGTGSFTFISSSSIPSLQNINNNTFTNLSVNTTGNVVFILRGGNMVSGNIENVNDNRIVGTFAKTGSGGAVNFFAANASSNNGSQMNQANNNFSGVTLTGTTTLTGWSNTEGATSTNGPGKNVSGNTFSNITVGSGAVVVMTLNFGAATTVSNNVITNVTGTGALTGITIGGSNSQGTHAYSGNTISGLASTGTGGSVVGIAGGSANIPTLNIANNTLSGLSTTSVGASNILGININAGTAHNITGNSVSGLSSATNAGGVVVGINEAVGVGPSTVTRNRVYDLQSTGTPTGAGAVVGISLNGGTSVTANHNLIADLRAPNASNTDAIRGMAVTAATASATYNVDYNTVLVNASSAGANFGTSALFHTVSATATTAALTLRNNVLVNLSTPNGTGATIAYRRSGTALNNYANASNNNIFFGGAPGAANLIFFDGTNSDQTIAAYRARVAPRDSLSLTEAPPFLSTVGSSPQFLHINPAIATQLESGGVPVAGLTTDVDGDTRNATTPDIGADEFNGIVLDLTAPTIAYAPLAGTSATGDRNLTATITDLSGIAGGALAPRIYFRKGAAPFVSNQCTGASPTYTCTIVAASMGGLVLGDTVSYFVVAQDTVGNVGANPSAGFTATDVNNVTSPPTTPNTYSIIAAFPTTVNVGTAEAITSLTNTGGLFEQMNAAAIAGNVTVNITSDLTAETGTVALNQLAEDAPGGFVVTIQSSTNVERLISGAAANALIRLNGADRITFEGNSGGSGQFLRLRNTNATNPTFAFLNDATFNRLRNVTIEGGNTTAASGVVLFGTTTGPAGNSDNLIEGSLIRDRSDAAGVPANLVTSNGTAGAGNARNVVRSTLLQNWTNIAALVSAAGAGDGWRIEACSAFQTAARTTAMEGITILGGNGHFVIDNAVGGGSVGANGAFLATNQTFRGIDLSVGSVTATQVHGNTVKNIRSTFPAASFTASHGIFLQAGRADIGTLGGNTIGSSDVNQRYEINGDSFAIRVVSTTNVALRNNVVNNFNTAANAPLGEFYFGISVEGAGGSHIIENNTVTNLINTSLAGGTDTQTIGMFVSATGTQQVRNNTISGIFSTNPGVLAALNNRVWGLIMSGTGVGSVVERNRISNLSAASTNVGARADIITFLQLQTLANATVNNNFISGDGGAADDSSVFGILDLNAAGPTGTYNYNSVNIFGTATGANNTFAFNRNGVATVNLRNNAFVNTRTGGTGFHVAMANSNPAATGWSATASDFNIVFNATPAHVTQWLGSAAANNMTLAQFQTASGGDANSLNVDPLFTGPNDLHIGAASPANQEGTPVAGVTTDIDGDARNAVTPDIGADEFNVPPSIAAVAVSRRAGDAASTSTIANVSDPEDAENAIAVTVNGGASATVNGVTVSGIAVDAAGVVTASVGASCLASDASFTLTATDSGSASATSSLNVTVTPNLPPVLTYGSTSLVFGASGTANPATGPSDTGSVSTIAVQSPGTFAGTTAVDNVTGVVSLGNAAPVGSHTVTIRATDNCGATTDANLTVNVGQGATTTTITSDTPDPSITGANVTVQFTVVAQAPASGTPTGTVNVSDGVNNCSATVAAGQCTVALTTAGTRTLTATYGGDVNFTGSSDTEQHVVGDQADLGISKTSSLDLVGSGLIQYTLIVSNAGPNGVVGAQVEDDLPAVLTNVTWTCTGTLGATCTGAGMGDIDQLVNLPSGSAVVYQITATVPLPFLITVSNTATVTEPDGVTDTNQANNSDSVTDGVGIFADGFEEPAFAAINATPLPASSNGMVLALRGTTVQPVDSRPVLVAHYAIGTATVAVQTRLIDGALQAQVLVRQAGGNWTVGAWTAVGDAGLRLVWSAQAGALDAWLTP